MTTDTRERRREAIVALGLRLRLARREAGLSQTTAALCLGKRNNTLWRWEHGLHPPSVPDLLAMATLYGKPPGWFFESCIVVWSHRNGK